MGLKLMLMPQSAPQFNSGHPFLEGEEVLHEASGSVPQRAFVLEANHPRYCLGLHNGQKIDRGVTSAGLLPQYVPGRLAPDMEDPFKDLQIERLVKSRSYGIQIDVQLEFFRRVWQAKELARVTKSDNTEIPRYLWNKRVEGFESAEQHDKLLIGFWRFVMLLFLNLPWRDLLCYLVETYGENWRDQPRKHGESLTPLDRDQLAITNII